MRPRVLARRADGLDERDLVLHLALGVVAASRRLDEVLAGPAARARRGAAAGPGEEAALSFVLGLISFRQRALAALTAARLAAAPRRPERQAPAGDLRGILR